ncbi:MAG: hypothetical protein V4573_09445 [Pseudomonadota bacterium]
MSQDFDMFGNSKQPHNNLLAQMLAKKPEITSAWYNNQEVTLDGYTFKGCRFDNCKLRVYSSNFVLDKCHIGEDCMIFFGNDQIKVIQLFNLRNQWIAKDFPNFAPLQHADKTISIGV